MNDRPTSGQYPDFGYDGLGTTTFAGDSTYVSYETQGQGVNYATYGSYETGAYDTTAWTSQDGYLSSIPAQTAPADTTGQWDSSAWSAPNTDYSGYQTAPSFGYDTSAEQTGHWAMPGYGTETGAYDATAWNTAGTGFTDVTGVSDATGYSAYTEQQQPAQQEYAYEATTVGYAYEVPSVPVADEPDPYAETSVFEPVPAAAADDAALDEAPEAPDTPGDPEAYESYEVPEVHQVHDLPTQAMPVTPGPRSARRNAPKGKGGGNAKAGSSSRRRTPAKRSALLTVAVPSACVMGVAGIAAASVGGLTGTEKSSDDTTTMAAPDPASVKPVAANTKLDTQLTALSADAGDFADRASRTQERIDLRLRQEEEKKKKAEEEAAKEAARPKFAIPVSQHGLSASFGQAGGMWMSVHTGIDFPVSYGTPVMAATDGTVRTQWNSAYGNMAIVTSPDGTETWYCHLSSTKIRSGKVKAGDVIAYSGNSGNSTGPHLHFEVRPGGGSAIDPLPWLRSHGLDPR
ncbi:peptidoglycan DD-metalloendopeptidase family protein [Streptomyces sp. NPDC056367]|uniref:peptidoglycan DD-metalloendopeptidase family protein n=1 Tax=Streptomyces sp. NPDC056367 TaxID=3345797 RepID=UPI0035D7B2D6